MTLDLMYSVRCFIIIYKCQMIDFQYSLLNVELQDHDVECNKLPFNAQSATLHAGRFCLPLHAGYPPPSSPPLPP